MSDFLDRLIERSFGLAPVAQPRLPSLFEPPREAMGLHVESPPDVEPVTHLSERAHAHAPARETRAARTDTHTSEQPRTHVGVYDEMPRPTPSRRRSADTHQPPTRLTEDAPAPTARTTDANPPPQVQRAAPPAPAPFVAPPTPPTQRRDYVARLLQPTPPVVASAEGASAVAASPPPAVSPPPIQPRPLSPTQDAAVVASDVTAAVPSPKLKRQVEASQPQHEEAPTRPARAARHTEARPVVNETGNEREARAPASPTPAPRAEPRPPRVVRAEDSKALVVQPRVVRHAAPQLETPAQTKARASEPVINVTIGRIEVRAAPPREGQSRTERQSSTPATMNLQEYLRRRSGVHNR